MANMGQWCFGSGQPPFLPLYRLSVSSPVRMIFFLACRDLKNDRMSVNRQSDNKRHSQYATMPPTYRVGNAPRMPRGPKSGDGGRGMSGGRRAIRPPQAAVTFPFWATIMRLHVLSELRTILPLRTPPARSTEVLLSAGTNWSAYE